MVYFWSFFWPGPPLSPDRSCVESSDQREENCTKMKPGLTQISNTAEKGGHGEKVCMSGCVGNGDNTNLVKCGCINMQTGQSLAVCGHGKNCGTKNKHIMVDNNGQDNNSIQDMILNNISYAGGPLNFH